MVGNYLKGDTPPPFDLLYWNGDSTNLPGPMYCWYLRNTYLENKLREPGALTSAASRSTWAQVDRPGFIYASREDHIVPWRSAYRVARAARRARSVSCWAPPATSPASSTRRSRSKRSHWTGDARCRPMPRPGCKRATEHPGSWWPRLDRLAQAQGRQAEAAPKTTGQRRYKAIEPAPGRYVKAKA